MYSYAGGKKVRLSSTADDGSERTWWISYGGDIIGVFDREFFNRRYIDNSLTSSVMKESDFCTEHFARVVGRYDEVNSSSKELIRLRRKVRSRYSGV